MLPFDNKKSRDLPMPISISILCACVVLMIIARLSAATQRERRLAEERRRYELLVQGLKIMERHARERHEVGFSPANPVTPELGGVPTPLDVVFAAGAHRY